ncbi:MAG: SPOR domain-containing protein [Rhodocyclales bacterium]|nr:SPOR domain-containing protein [Rhodocyclales bacterium]
MGKFGKFDRNRDKTSDKVSRAASSTRGPQKNSSGGTLLGIFIGLVIGMLIAFGVVWYLNKSPLPFQNKYEGAPKTEKEQPVTPGGAAATAQTPAPLPGKPGDKAVDRQRFEFYGILEGNKQPSTPGAAVPATPLPGVSIAPAVEVKPAPSETFFLQVGAFQKAADADNLKAKLALTGLEASVQEVSVPEKGTMHRVRVGPFRDPEEMNRARTLLSQSGVQGTVIKQKE